MTPAEQVVKALRVLLMVERDGRVVCVRRWNAEPDLSSFHWAVYLWAVYLEGRTYWLVEAESAEAARQIIAAKKSWRGDVLDKSERTLYASPDGTLFEGRILAPGGRK